MIQSYNPYFILQLIQIKLYNRTDCSAREYYVKPLKDAGPRFSSLNILRKFQQVQIALVSHKLSRSHRQKNRQKLLEHFSIMFRSFRRKCGLFIQALWNPTLLCTLECTKIWKVLCYQKQIHRETKTKQKTKREKKEEKNGDLTTSS